MEFAGKNANLEFPTSKTISRVALICGCNGEDTNSFDNKELHQKEGK